MEKTKLTKIVTFGLVIALIAGVACVRSFAKDNKKQAEPAESKKVVKKITPTSMKGALFIGDSRTVGLMEYSEMEDPDFFCSVGMSTMNINDECVSVPKVGKVTLEELLSNKKYSKIYLMLGINEVGCDTDTVISNYAAIIDSIREKQPDAKIFVEANLHVTKDKSDTDNLINNEAIDKLNSKMSEFANDKDIFYMDANPEFDDDEGNLSSDLTSDGVHLYAKHYIKWGQWISTETTRLLKEN